ncbi:hypothetical protein FDK38_005038 [Candidozyma auris]|nr:hypothetical protein FDK38_005038 [[Candida] auris]
MARSKRGSRHLPSSDDEMEEGGRRSRRPVSYLEESDDAFDEIKEEDVQKEEDGVKEEDGEVNAEPEADAEEPEEPEEADSPEEDNLKDEDFDEDDEIIPAKRSRSSRRVSRRLRQSKGSDDSDFKEDEVSGGSDNESDAFEEEDDYMERLREKQFVASDEDGEEDNYYGYSSTSKSRSRRKPKSRSRSAEPRRSRKRMRRAADDDEEEEAEDNDDDVGDIQQEIQELYDSSPEEESPVKHKLRERGEKVNYTIPPAITNEQDLDALSAARYTPPSKRNRRNVGNKSDFRKLLFPTAGPFGGSDVISLLGQNIPPGGIPIPGMPADARNNLIADNDSDSSDEEFVPSSAAGAQPRPSVSGSMGKVPMAANNAAPAPSGMLNNTKIVGASSVGDKGKKKSTLSDTDPLGVDMNIDFSAVGGLDGYIDQLKEMVALPLLYPELYQNFSITPPRGVLFHGPPGTGKTLMARALAASCSTPSRKITFFMRKGADCLSKWVGEAERQLRLLFEEAKNQQPSIIFFDEIDGLAPVRSSKQEQIHASIVSTLLALMDGMDNRGQVIVIGATNRPDSVDPALRRPGRFDREFYFPLPDLDARKQILSIHTRKWDPPLSPVFLDKIAGLTKGYGGADLRALCTEAALNSIQRKYPQIYRSSDKLKVDPTKVKVIAKDFMRAIERIVPSSARSTSTGSSPLPERLQPLLQGSLEQIVEKLTTLLPDSISLGGKKKLTNLEEAMYLDPTVKDADGGFSKHELLRSLEGSRICKPHLLICGEAGAGQQYLGAAILNALEGFQVQNLDLATIFSDVTRTPESCIVQTFIEARRHQPSIVFIPNIDTWFDVMTHSAKATLAGLLRNLKSNEKILLLGIAERSFDDLDPEVKHTLGISGDSNNVYLENPDIVARKNFFQTAEKALKMKPYEFVNDLSNRPKRKLKELPVVPQETVSVASLGKKRDKQQEYEDKRLKNLLKIKLAGLMDLFKNRYKRFRKPIIDEGYLHHLFEPSILDNPMITYEVAYTISEDPKHPNMIKELSTGKFFFNMDLDTIEERIWNGFYSEAKQFLKDIRMIVKDAIQSGDRERILKANEMMTNAQFGIDDFNNPEFAKACKDLRAREIEKQAKLLEDYKKLKAEYEKQQAATSQVEGELPNGTAPMQLLGDSDQATLVGANGHTHEATDNSVKDKPEEIDERTMEDAKGPSENAPQNEVRFDGAVEEEATDVVDESPKSQKVAPVTQPPESESEAEEETLTDATQELVIPPEAYDFFEDRIVKLTEGFTVEKLEFTMAKIMDIIWADRSQWNKAQTTEKLYKVAETLHHYI